MHHLSWLGDTTRFFFKYGRQSDLTPEAGLLRGQTEKKLPQSVCFTSGDRVATFLEPIVKILQHSFSYSQNFFNFGSSFAHTEGFAAFIKKVIKFVLVGSF